MICIQVDIFNKYLYIKQYIYIYISLFIFVSFYVNPCFEEESEWRRTWRGEKES